MSVEKDNHSSQKYGFWHALIFLGFLAIPALLWLYFDQIIAYLQSKVWRWFIFSLGGGQKNWIDWSPSLFMTWLFVFWAFLCVWLAAKNRKLFFLSVFLFFAFGLLGVFRYVGFDREDIVFNRFLDQERISLDQLDSLVVEFNKDPKASKEEVKCQVLFYLHLRNQKPFPLQNYVADKVSFFVAIKEKKPLLPVICKINYWYCEGVDHPVRNLCEEIVYPD